MLGRRRRFPHLLRRKGWRNDGEKAAVFLPFQRIPACLEAAHVRVSLTQGSRRIGLQGRQEREANNVDDASKSTKTKLYSQAWELIRNKNSETLPRLHPDSGNCVSPPRWFQCLYSIILILFLAFFVLGSSFRTLTVIFAWDFFFPVQKALLVTDQWPSWAKLSQVTYQRKLLLLF